MGSSIRDAGKHDTFRWAPTFELRHRIRRTLWAMTWALFASWTPPPLHRWRAFLLRLFGARLHTTVKVYGSARVWDPVNLHMGAFSTLGPRVICYSMDAIHIGHHVVVSQGAHLCCGTHDIRSPSFQLFAKPITIGANAWICAEAFVGPGVSIGEGAVLAARSVAFSDLASWSVYRGNPAVLIKERPSFHREC